MNILEMELFLGLPVTPLLATALSESNPHLRKIFIQENPDYLQEVTTDKGTFLGKRLGSVADVEALDLLKANITSLLGRLCESTPIDPNTLELLPVPKT